MHLGMARTRVPLVSPTPSVCKCPRTSPFPPPVSSTHTKEKENKNDCANIKMMKGARACDGQVLETLGADAASVHVSMGGRAGQAAGRGGATTVVLLHFLDLNKTQFNSQCMPSKRMRCTRAAKARCVSAVLRPQAVHSALGIPVEQTSEWLLSRCMRRACNDIMMLPEICNCMPHAIVTQRTKTHTGPALTVRLVMEITLALSRARRDRSSSRVPVAIVKTRHLKTHQPTSNSRTPSTLTRVRGL